MCGTQPWHYLMLQGLNEVYGAAPAAHPAMKKALTGYEDVWYPAIKKAMMTGPVDVMKKAFKGEAMMPFRIQ